ncbi:MAG: hypothetical protein IPJ65_34630 [Archangiaceae bacterium]|nr:hypothetical protein [Archangiaceae bacterium]
MDEGQPLSALDYFNKAMSNNPDHLRSKVGIALARLERKDRVADAADTIKDLLGREAELSPWLKGRVYATAAELANFEAQWDAAINASDKALSVNPDEQWALYAKAKALAGKKDAGAAAAFDAAVAKARTSPVFYFDGATLLQQAGQTDAAIALLDKYEAVFKPIVNTTADGKTVGALDRDDRYWLTRGDVRRDARASSTTRSRRTTSHRGEEREPGQGDLRQGLRCSSPRRSSTRRPSSSPTSPRRTARERCPRRTWRWARFSSRRKTGPPAVASTPTPSPS